MGARLRHYRYAVLDVFTDTALAGNALAVVPDAAGLDVATMQAVAREFALSETVFVLPPENPLHSARLRIFTPVRELPFAGHPTVGTAVYLGRARVGDTAGSHELVLVLEEKVGPVRCGIAITDTSARAVFDLPNMPEQLSVEFHREAVAAALGLVPAEIGFENHQPSAFSAGVPYSFVPVRDLETIGKTRVNESAWSAAFPAPVEAAYLYCRETVRADSAFHARMFAPGLGITEDPATGSAAAAFAGVVQHFDTPPAGSHRYVIEQGLEMSRASFITLEADIEGGAVAAARIGGDAVVVAEGTLYI